MSLPFNITNPGLYISGLLTSAEQNFVTNLVLAGATASEDDVLTWISGAPSWEHGKTFETISKNLNVHNSSLNYTGDNLTSIVYSNGITKTFNYTGDNLTSVVLSGSTPSGILLTKTLTYSGGTLISVTYS